MSSAESTTRPGSGLESGEDHHPPAKAPADLGLGPILPGNAWVLHGGWALRRHHLDCGRRRRPAGQVVLGRRCPGRTLGRSSSGVLAGGAGRLEAVLSAPALNRGSAGAGTPTGSPSKSPHGILAPTTTPSQPATHHSTLLTTSQRNWPRPPARICLHLRHTAYLEAPSPRRSGKSPTNSI